MTTTTSRNETTINVRGTQVQMFTGGSGAALVFLHGAGGNPGWQPYLESLSQSHTVYAPSHPGFNGTRRPDWVSRITDVAHFTQYLVQELGLNQYVLMGSSMGGWIAAEMAAMCPHNIRGLILVDAAGIKPQQGQIAEIFMVGAQVRQSLRFHNPSQVPNIEELTREMTPEEAAMDHSNREMASRLCWKPYLHNPSLPDYLGKVSTPACIIWGRQDAIIPVECAELYRQALPNATVRIIDNCGHSPQLEKPQEFLSAVNQFISGLR